MWFGCQYSVSRFNVTKNIKYAVAKGRANKHQAFVPDFCIIGLGKSVEYVNKYVHLGHVISADLSDNDDIQRCRSTLVGQINNVICFFGKLDPVIKMKLLISYCFNLYGCTIWNLMNPGIEQVCSAWTAGLRRVWGLPRTVHNNLLPLISCQPPLSDAVAKRFISYVQLHNVGHTIR